MRRLRLFVLAVLSAGFLVACGGASQRPAGDDASSGPDPVPPPRTSARFDLSRAVGLQLGWDDAAAVRAAAATSGLTKVLDDGSLEDALVEGEVTVVDFVVRNGKVYVVLQATDAEPCVLGEVAPDGSMTCVDGELSSISVGEIQFDANGGIYYRGSLADGSTVIRRNLDGALTDFYVARDAIVIERFVVTRSGIVLAQGYSSGDLANQYWIREIDASGLTTNHPYGVLLDYLPDGTLLYTESGVLRRFLVHDRVETDPRPYCGFAAFARLAPAGFECGFLAEAILNNRAYRSPSTMIALVSSGLFSYYPTANEIPIPIKNLSNGVLSAGTAAIAGYNEAGEPAAYLVNLDTGGVIDMLGAARIDVLRLKLELDTERVMLYGVDLDRNQAVLAEYSMTAGTLNTADIDAGVADTFEPLQFSVDDVPPDVVETLPNPMFTFAQLSGSDENRVAFDASMTPDLQWIDEITWDFGDGSFSPGDHTNTIVAHTYATEGTYTVTVTVTTFLGVRRTATEDVTLTYTVPEPAFSYAAQAGLAAGFVAFDAMSTMMREHITHLSWDFGDGSVPREGNPKEDASLWTPIHAYQIAATYVVSLAATSFHGVTGAAEETVAVDLVRTQVSIGAGTNHSLAVGGDGVAWSWGDGLNGQLATGDALDRTLPVVASELGGTTLTLVDGGSNNSVALDANGDAWLWGQNVGGSVVLPILVEAPAGVSFEYVTQGSSAFALGSDGAIWTLPSLSRIVVPDGSATGFIDVSAGQGHVLAVDRNGNAWAWGENSSGQLGDGTATSSAFPVRVVLAEETRLISVSAGALFSIGLDANGSAWAWGYGYDYRLGTGSFQDQVLPVPVVMPEGVRFTAVSAGGRHGLAIDTEGGVWAWGGNYNGQLGTLAGGGATPVRSATPVGLRFTAISAGGNHSLALDELGRTWGWGYSYDGQVGIDIIGSQGTPVRVGIIRSLQSYPTDEP